MFKRFIFIICILGMILPGFANNLVSKDHLPILASQSNGNDKSSSISASIEGHNLTIIFLSNLGHVEIKITDATGVTLEIDHSETPAGYLYNIPSVGHYVVVITLSDGDEYYGEFDVTA